MYNPKNIDILLGRTLLSVEQVADERLIFVCDDGSRYEMYHEQDCCESVYIQSVTGDLKDLVGSPITLARESSNSREEESVYDYGSCTWTFYSLATVKGYVDIRWCGSSNGYYSESVSFVQVD